MSKPPQITPTERTPSALNLLPEEPELDQYEKILGALVMRLSLFHFMLEVYLLSLLKLDLKSGRTITGDLPITSLIERLKRVAKAKAEQPELASLEKILKELGKIIEARNRFVHALWHFPDDGPARIIPKKGNPVDEEAPSLQYMYQLIDKTETLLNVFIDECMNKKLIGQAPKI